MKISSFIPTVQFPSIARAKKEGENTYQEGERDHSNQQDAQKNPQKNPKDLDQAVAEFQLDEQSKANGLNASLEGSGPGLKVVLKDTTGGVIRQFSGEEFLRLREAVSKDGRKLGKILDQKL